VKLVPWNFPFSALVYLRFSDTHRNTFTHSKVTANGGKNDNKLNWQQKGDEGKKSALWLWLTFATCIEKPNWKVAKSVEGGKLLHAFRPEIICTMWPLVKKSERVGNVFLYIYTQTKWFPICLASVNSCWMVLEMA